MCADKNPLMDYCDDISDFLDRVTDDIYAYICDYEDYDDLKDLIDELKEAYYPLINAWNMAEEKTRYIRNELEEGETE